MTGTETLELALAIASLVIASVVEVKANGRDWGMWAMILCDAIWIIRLVPALHGT